MDEATRLLTADWLAKADEDHRAAKLLIEGATLSPLAVEYRYPGDTDAPDPHLAFSACREVLEAVRASLPATLFPTTWPTN